MKVSEFKQNNPITTELREKLDETLKTVERARWVRAFSSCGCCSTELHFDHQIEAGRERIVETAHCPSCGSTVPSRQYTMN